VAGSGDSDFDVLGYHTYATAGSYTITATVTDDGGQTVTLTGTTVVAVPTTHINAAPVPLPEMFASFSPESPLGIASSPSAGFAPEKGGPMSPNDPLEPG
jgi:PKD repeat protein